MPLSHPSVQSVSPDLSVLRGAVTCWSCEVLYSLCSPIPLLRPDMPFLQDNLVFVVGKLDGLMVVGVRRHNADDIVATALAVEPMKFVYRGR